MAEGSGAHTGQHVVVTGAASGIGLAAATVLRDDGAQVLVSDVDDEQLERVREQGFETVHCDVSDEEQVVGLMARARELFGHLDVLVNNAGIAGPTGPVDQLASDDWRRTFEVNIHGQFYCVKHGLDLLRAGTDPAIVNMSSAAGRLGFPGRSPYSATKWAVVGFTKTLAAELGPEGIRANAICPGVVDNDRIRRVIAAKAEMLGRTPEDVEQEYVRLSAMQTMVTERDVAEAVRYLSSPAARRVSGQVLAVDGNTDRLA